MKSKEEIRLKDLMAVLTNEEKELVYLTVGTVKSFDDLDESARLRFIAVVIRDVTHYKDLYKLYSDRMGVVERFLSLGDEPES